MVMGYMYAPFFGGEINKQTDLSALLVLHIYRIIVDQKKAYYNGYILSV